MKESFFLKDKIFFKSLFRIMIVVAFQNLVNYSVNMADNIMLGSYGQAELSGAAIVSQIFFILNAFLYNIGTSFSVLAAQSWGKKDTDSINRFGGIELKSNFVVGVIFFVLASIMPYQLVGIFTSNPEIAQQAVMYLSVLKWTFIPYAISVTMMDLLRNVETVNISFYMSIVSLVINVILNYALIFGKLGFPCLGVRGAAIATLVARIVEVLVLVFYVWKIDKKLHFFNSEFYKWNGALVKKFYKIAAMIIPGGIAWSLATPIQGALLGLLSDDAIAANSVTSTYYQLFKVVAQAMSSAAAVIIGKMVGEAVRKSRENAEKVPDFSRVRAGARTIQVFALAIGFLLAVMLFFVRTLVLNIYDLTPEAERLTNNMLIIMSVIIIGMSYEVSTLFGIIRAGGNTRFPTITNVAITWCISMPLAFMAVYWWGLSAEWVVIIIQSEQIIKCIPASIYARKYNKWIINVTG